MTDTATPTFFASLDVEARKAEAAQQRVETEARASYWRDIDAVLDGNESGIDLRLFRKNLATLGLTVEAAKDDAATIRRIRAVEANDDATRQAVAVAMQAADEAEAAERVAAAAHEAATRTAREARQRANHAGIPLEARDAKGDPTREEKARVAARKDALALTERGYQGRLLRPVVEPKPRMARFIGPAPAFVLDATRRPGDVLAIPPTVMLEEPPRAMKPGEVPPLRMSYLIDANAPWPPVTRRRCFRATGNFTHELLGIRRVGDEVVREIPDGETLPWCLEELPLPAEAPPEPAITSQTDDARSSETVAAPAVSDEPENADDQSDPLAGLQEEAE